MIEIKVRDQPIVAALGRLQSATRDMSPVMSMIAQELERQTEKNFAEEGRPKWMGIQPRKGRNGGMILQDSGQLAASVTSSHDATSATIGSNKIYAAIHQFGGKTKPHVIRARNKQALAFGGIVRKSVNHPGSNIPARPFLPVDAQGNLQQDTQSAVMSVVNDYLRNVIG